MPNTSLPTDELKRLYREAYVDVRSETLPKVPEPRKIGQAGGEPFVNDIDPFGNNLIGYYGENYHYFLLGSRRKHLWTGYMVAGFQGFKNPVPGTPIGGDGDGNIEFGRGGVNYGLSVFDKAGMVYLEALRDASEIFRWKDAEYALMLAKTVAHEFTHQWGISDGTGGLMSYDNSGGGVNDVEHRSPLLLPHLWRIRTSVVGPGD